MLLEETCATYLSSFFGFSSDLIYFPFGSCSGWPIDCPVLFVGSIEILIFKIYPSWLVGLLLLATPTYKKYLQINKII